jgi:hypothetical protein
MILYLRHLQEFTYKYYCTDELIEQLALNCSHLKKVSLYGSGEVTNAAVPHLLQLQELQFLELEKTRISTEHYGLLVSQLPQIKNIQFRYEDRYLLDYIAVKKLDSLSHVKGYVPNMNMLTQRCRNITNLDIDKYRFDEDLSSLAALTSLCTLHIEWVNYARCNFKAVLTSIGPRLTQLSLCYIENLNHQDIVTLCPSLESLALYRGSCLPLNTDATLDPQLQHFRNLISLSIICVIRGETILNSIRYYVSLKRISFNGVNIFTVEFIRDVLNSGAFANLEEFEICYWLPEVQAIEAGELLMERCSHLKIFRCLDIFGKIIKSYI